MATPPQVVDTTDPTPLTISSITWEGKDAVLTLADTGGKTYRAVVVAKVLYRTARDVFQQTKGAPRRALRAKIRGK